MKNFLENFKKQFDKLPTDLDGAVSEIGLPPVNVNKFNFPSATVLYIISFLYPILFLPLLANWFDLPKQILVLIGALLIFLFLVLKALPGRRIEIVRSPFDLPLVALAIISLVSSYLANNRWANMWADPVTYLGAVFLFLTVTQTINKEELLHKLVRVFLLGSVVLSVWTALQLGINFISGYVRAPFFALPIFSLNFSPTGSYFTQTIYLAICLPLTIGLYLKLKKKTDLLVSVLVAVGLALSLLSIYRNIPVILPLDAGWKIATGVMGNSFTTALVGVGPANYIDAFNLLKPLSFNLGNLWNVRFGAGASFYLYLLTTVGIAGMTAFVWISYRFAQIAKKRLGVSSDTFEKGLLVSLVVSLISLVFLPGPMVVVFTFFLLLGIFVAKANLDDNPMIARKVNLGLENKAYVLPIVLVLSIVLAGFLAFNLGRLAVADYYFGESINAAAANDGTKTYNSQIRAISLNPDNDNYHLAYSQTNLALADSLAGQPNLTDQQKQTVISLIQQSIREARIAASLNPQRASSWENLALIYRSLVGFAQDAEQWAVASLNQAIALDPYNPRLRLDLGGMYYAAGDFAGAAQMFSQATNLKPDLANAHYNLAQALKNLKLNTQAVSELQLTANLICSPNQEKSADCKRVEDEIAQLGSQVVSPPAQPAETQPPLSTPSAQVTTIKPVVNPPAKISSPSGEITQ